MQAPPRTINQVQNVWTRPRVDTGAWPPKHVRASGPRAAIDRAACCRAAASGALSDRSETSIASEVYHEQPAQDVAPHALLRSLDFHLLFFISFAAIGAGLALLDNFPQLLQSIAPRDAAGAAALPPNLDNSLLIVFSVANTLGRIAAGFGPEHALHKWVRQPIYVHSQLEGARVYTCMLAMRL